MEFRSEKYPRLRVVAEGVSVRFEDGVYETDDPAVIDVLKANGNVEAVEAEKPKRQKRQAKPKADEKPAEPETPAEGESPEGAAEAAETEE